VREKKIVLENPHIAKVRSDLTFHTCEFSENLNISESTYIN
jgi:hypothetical protein